MNSGKFWWAIPAVLCGTLVFLFLGCPQVTDLLDVPETLAPEQVVFGNLVVIGVEAGKTYTAEVYQYNSGITTYAEYIATTAPARKIAAGASTANNAEIEIALGRAALVDTSALKGGFFFVSIKEIDDSNEQIFYLDGVFFNTSGRAEIDFAAMRKLVFPVTLKDLTGLLVFPGSGARPDPVFKAAEEYTGSGITWTRVDGGSMGEFFILDVPYRAQVTLSPAESVTFSEIDTPNFFSYDRAVSVTNTLPEPDNDSVTVTIVFPPTALNPVDARDLTAYFLPPVQLRVPKDQITGAQYSGTISWKTGGTSLNKAAFDRGTEYQAVVTLTAAAGFTFAGVEANSFSHSGADTVTNPAGDGTTITVTVSFPPDTGEDFTDLTTLLPAPVRLQTPEKTITAARYTGTVAWYDEGGVFNQPRFAAEKVYTAEVTLTANQGYTFAGVAEYGFMHSGATEVTNPAGSGTTITVTIKFPETNHMPVPLEARDLTNLMKAPAGGAKVTRTLDKEDYYTGTIAWEAGNGQTFTLFEGDAFAAGVVYRAVASLTAGPDYTFDGVEANSFSHDGADTVTNPAGSGQTIIVTVTFRAAPVSVIYSASVGGLVLPKGGEEPVAFDDLTAGDSSCYTVESLIWNPAVDDPPGPGLFKPYTQYTATITLKAAAGYRFDSGIIPGTNNVGAPREGTVQNDGGVSRLTFDVTFPATGVAPVDALDLTDLVTAPVEYGLIVDTRFEEAEYAGTVTWLNRSLIFPDYFVPGPPYCAQVTLVATLGYTFTGVDPESFTYRDPLGVEIDVPPGGGQAITVYITFPAFDPEDVNNLNLTDAVTAPVRGGTPSSAIDRSPQYTGTVTWKALGGGRLNDDGSFMALTVYQAEVALTVGRGYTFTGVEPNSFTHTGAAEITNPAATGYGEIITVTIIFPQTKAVIVDEDSLDLTGLLTAPVTEAEPKTTPFERPQYKGIVVWTPTVAEDEFFQASQVYTAEVTLTAINGYTFEGLEANQFKYTGATSVTHLEGTGTVLTVKITFPATADPPTDADPVAASFNRPRYTGTGMWKTSEGGGLSSGGRFKHTRAAAATNPAVMKPGADGRRLPTEAEWEYAARGGVPS